MLKCYCNGLFIIIIDMYRYTEMIIALCCLQILLYPATALREISPSNFAKQKDANKKFAGMLEELISLNERRFEAVKNLARLEDYGVNQQELRMNQETADTVTGRNRNKREDKSTKRHSSEEEPTFVMVFNVDKNSRMERIERARQINEALEPYRSLRDSPQLEMTECLSDEEDDDDEEGLPIARSLRSSKGHKTCKKACVKALKNVCQTFQCKRSMKSKFKKQCKLHCKRTFAGHTIW